MSPCESFESEWPAWDPLVDAQPRDAAFAGHLGTCADCRRRAEALRSTAGLLRRVADEVPVPAVSREFGARLLSRLDALDPGPIPPGMTGQPERDAARVSTGVGRAWAWAWRWVWGGAVAGGLALVVLLVQDRAGLPSQREGRDAGSTGVRMVSHDAGESEGGGPAEWARYRRALEESPEALERLMAWESAESLVLGQPVGAVGAL